MPRETKEERELRRAAESHAALIERQNYLATVPKRLSDLTSLAASLGISTQVQLGENGPFVKFHDDNNQIDDTLHYTSEEWTLEYMERKVRDIKDEQDARKERRLLAEDVWKNKLTSTERVAIKENIHYLGD